MFRRDPDGAGVALNAKTARSVLAIQTPAPDDLFQLHRQPGVGLCRTSCIWPRPTTMWSRLDAKTGKVVWDTKFQDYKKGQYLTSDAVVIDGKGEFVGGFPV